jgi:pyrroloquinoline quinone biosynthesis protein D
MILYPERGLVLNASAAEIVKLCDGTRSLEQIAETLAASSGAPLERVSGDVRALVARLEEKRLLE